MGRGEWGRIVAAVAIGLGGLLLVRGREEVTSDQFGTLIFILAVFYVYRRIAHHFDKDRRGGRP